MVNTLSACEAGISPYKGELIRCTLCTIVQRISFPCKGKMSATLTKGYLVTNVIN